MVGDPPQSEKEEFLCHLIKSVWDSGEVGGEGEEVMEMAPEESNSHLIN